MLPNYLWGQEYSLIEGPNEKSNFRRSAPATTRPSTRLFIWGLSASNKVVCAEVAEIMKGSGYMQGTRESLMDAVIELAFYEPDPVDD
jgi:hypothetical protein